MKRKRLIKFFVFLLVTYILGCHKAQPQEPKAIQAEAAREDNVVGEKIVEKEQDAVRFTALINRLDQRNPFTKDHAGLYKLKMASGTLRLGGILYDGQKPMAIINDQIVRVGDIIEDKEVIKITSEEVVLKDRQEERTYKLEVIK